MSRYLVQVKEVQPDLRFYFIQVGKREYFRPHRTIWLTPKLIRNERGEEFVEFPLKGKIVVTEKGTVKLLSSAEHTTYEFPSLSGKSSIRTYAAYPDEYIRLARVSIPFREELHSDNRKKPSCSRSELWQFPSLSGKSSIRTKNCR